MFGLVNDITCSVYRLAQVYTKQQKRHELCVCVFTANILNIIRVANKDKVKQLVEAYKQFVAITQKTTFVQENATR